MPGDFDERLAAVDDALADSGTGASSPDVTATGSGTDSDTTTTRGSSPTERPGDSAGRRDGTAPTEAELSSDSRSASPPQSTHSPGRFDDASEERHGSAKPGAVDVSALTDRVSELEAAVQAIRGYTGSVRAVNDRVEERADAALATVETLQDRVDGLERRLDERARSDGGVARRSSGRIDRRSDAHDQSTSAHSGADAGSVRSPRPADRGPGNRGSGDDRTWTRSDGDGTPPAWPPDNPRDPYGDRPTEDDTDGRGLVARLRDLL